MACQKTKKSPPSNEKPAAAQQVTKASPSGGVEDKAKVSAAAPKKEAPKKDVDAAKSDGKEIVFDPLKPPEPIEAS